MTYLKDDAQPDTCAELACVFKNKINPATCGGRPRHAAVSVLMRPTARSGLGKTREVLNYCKDYLCNIHNAYDA